MEDKDSKELAEKIKRPENCPYLVTPRVNDELWKRWILVPEVARTQDVKLAHVQKRLTAGMIPVVYVANITLHCQQWAVRRGHNRLFEDVVRGIAHAAEGQP